jgi:hypothetical protein
VIILWHGYLLRTKFQSIYINLPRSGNDHFCSSFRGDDVARIE